MSHLSPATVVGRCRAVTSLRARRPMATVLESLLVAMCYVQVVFCGLALHEDLRQHNQVQSTTHRVACSLLHLHLHRCHEIRWVFCFGDIES